MTNDELWFWVCNLKNIYQPELKRIFNIYTCPEELFNAQEDELAERILLDEERLRTILDPENRKNIFLKYEKMLKSGIRFIHQGSPDYPDCLEILNDRPYGLYVKGNHPSQLCLSVGMVGARACSGYGREYAARFSKTLAAENIQIISGMAVGIDSISARGAVDAGGKTFAILGSGVDVIYPRENIELYYDIITSGGGIISEYPMGTPPLPWQFPHRNRLISAFSDKLIVIEAGKRSGTLSTAMHALDQGKDVYALPGRINDRLSEGCNQLIADGAGVLTDINEFIAELKSEHPKAQFSDICYGINENTGGMQAGPYEALLNLISFEPVTSHLLIEMTGLSPEIVLQNLAEMELEGIITKLSGDYYAKV